MKNKGLLILIQNKLEKSGTTFTDYYGIPIYRSGPKPKEFFSSVNEGNYTVEPLIIPHEFFITKIDTEKVEKFLKGEIND